MSETVGDQRLECRRTPNEPVAVEALASLGVFVRRLDPDAMLAPSADGRTDVDRIMELLHYPVRDEVCCSPDTLQDYDAKIRSFFIEHAHEDDEVRLIKAGVGYFDVRDENDGWVRIRVTPGDLLVLPAGCYHRFTLDTTNFVHAIRLFSTAPRWVPLNRPCDDHPVRVAYASAYLSGKGCPHTPLVDWGEDVTVVRDPNAFTSQVRGVVRGMRREDITVIYFRGAPLPRTATSWCGDCVSAETNISGGLARLREGHPSGTVRYIEVLIERESYRDRADYPLRSHPFAQLQAIPTIVALKWEAGPSTSETEAGAADDGVEEVYRFQGSIPADWVHHAP